ncbi:MAG: hypothetical protein AAFO69_08985 [Bacteroidota bacterium]
MSNYTKWMLLSPISLILIGAGICFCIESAFLKHDNPASNSWIWYGTGALIVLNSGFSLLGHAVFIKVKDYLERRGLEDKETS